MGRAKIAITEQDLRAILGLADDVDIRTVTASQDPNVVYVHVTGSDVADWPTAVESPIYPLARAEVTEGLLQKAGAALNVTLAHLDGRMTERDEEALGGAQIVLADIDAALQKGDGPKHIEGSNAEDCPGCAGTNPPYPFICPGDDRYRAVAP